MPRSPNRKSGILRANANRRAFIDRLTERWLFERSTITLYELVLGRLKEAELARFLDEERLHLAMLEQLLSELGVHPREEPARGAATIAASEMSPLVELARADGLEPRHLVQVLYTAERLEAGGWELLVELGKEVDLDEDWLRSFRAAARTEAEHEHFLGARLRKLESAALTASEW